MSLLLYVTNYLSPPYFPVTRSCSFPCYTSFSVFFFLFLTCLHFCLIVSFLLSSTFSLPPYLFRHPYNNDSLLFVSLSEVCFVVASSSLFILSSAFLFFLCLSIHCPPDALFFSLLSSLSYSYLIFLFFYSFSRTIVCIFTLSLFFPVCFVSRISFHRLSK